MYFSLLGPLAFLNLKIFIQHFRSIGLALNCWQIVNYPRSHSLSLPPSSSISSQGISSTPVLHGDTERYCGYVCLGPDHLQRHSLSLHTACEGGRDSWSVCTCECVRWRIKIVSACVSFDRRRQQKTSSCVRGRDID